MRTLALILLLGVTMAATVISLGALLWHLLGPAIMLTAPLVLGLGMLWACLVRSIVSLCRAEDDPYDDAETERQIRRWLSERDEANHKPRR